MDIKSIIRNYGPTARVSGDRLTMAEIVCMLISLFVLLPLTFVVLYFVVIWMGD